jgi:tetratricopeptide (TPR) repeat protein
LAKSAAEKALAIDPANSEAHSVLGTIAAICDYDWKAVEQHFHKAMAAEPVPPMVRFRYVQYHLLPFRRFAEAIGQNRLALETDPLSMVFHSGTAVSLYYAKQYQETIECARRALEMDPNFYFIWFTMGLAQLHAGFTQEAITSLKRVLELAPWFHTGVGYLAAVYYRAGDRERSQEWAGKLVSHGDTFGAAVYYAAAGEVDAMFEALDEAYRQRDWYLHRLRYEAFFDPYRADPRYQPLLQRMNLA